MKTPALAFLALAVVGCGGGDSAAYDAAVEAANIKKAEAVALAATSPCTTNGECGYLTFVPVATCGSWTYKPFSVVSASAAAASAAASEHRQLARTAIQLQPPTSIACAAVITPAPTVECRASTCQEIQ